MRSWKSFGFTIHTFEYFNGRTFFHHPTKIFEHDLQQYCQNLCFQSRWYMCIFRCASISCTDGRNRLTDSLTHSLIETGDCQFRMFGSSCTTPLVFYPVGMFVWSVWSTCSVCSVWSPGSHWSVWSPCSVWSPQSVWSLLLVWSSRSCSHPGQSDHNWHNLHFA